MSKSWKTCFGVVLWNRLNVNEILIFKEFQLSGALKNTYVSLNYECYNHNISNFSYEISLNTILTQLVSNILSTYFYETKVVQILYPTFDKINVWPMVLYFYFKIFWIYFLMSISKIVPFFNWTLGGLLFFVYFNLLTPKAMALKMFKTLTLMFTQSYVLNQSWGY